MKKPLSKNMPRKTEAVRTVSMPKELVLPLPERKATLDDKKMLAENEPAQNVKDSKVTANEQKAPVAKKADIFIPQSRVQLEDVSIAERRETPLKSLDDIVTTDKTPKAAVDNDLKNYGPGTNGKFYEKGSYKSARYEDSAKYEPAKQEIPGLEPQPEISHSGMHATDAMFQQFSEMKKREEENLGYKKQKKST